MHFPAQVATTRIKPNWRTEPQYATEDASRAAAAASNATQRWEDYCSYRGEAAGALHDTFVKRLTAECTPSRVEVIAAGPAASPRAASAAGATTLSDIRNSQRPSQQNPAFQQHELQSRGGARWERQHEGALADPARWAGVWVSQCRLYPTIPARRSQIHKTTDLPPTKHGSTPCHQTWFDSLTSHVNSSNMVRFLAIARELIKHAYEKSFLIRRKKK